MIPSAPFSRQQKSSLVLFGLLGVFIGCRLLLLIFAPHQDPSEARYAEISRKMVETGDWITPQHLYGVAFWAKPPLSMWLSGLGMEIFGINEFGSRIFIFLAAIGMLFLIGRFAWREWSPTAGIASAVMLMGMPVFFYCSAAVMTDLALAAGTTLAMIAFRLAVLNSSKAWGYAFFVGLAIGLLAKGPLAWVIVAPPLIGWLTLSNRWSRSWKTIPWISGTGLMVALALPWYLMAEQKTPGFLAYFLIGEHWNRFVHTGWAGDLYGKAHAEPVGTIWLYALLGTFPWCLGFLAIPFRRWRNFPSWALKNDGLGGFLLLWAAWPILFFTPARNIISTYPLPAIPAIALLLSQIFHDRFGSSENQARFHPMHPSIVGISIAMMAWALLVTLAFPELSPKSSERELVRHFETIRQPDDSLVYYGNRKYSAEFYSGGKALTARSPETLDSLLKKSGTLYVAMAEKTFSKLPPALREKLEPAGRSKLFRERLLPSPAASAIESTP
jgi:4-amino-4-deoxy-L-arabinose transferase-like glycosyltransferase